MPEQLVESINDTARMARAVLSLLLVAALLVVLTLSFSTNENLFRNVSVELPQIGIGISIKQSYILAPLIFLYLHIQMLYLLNVLARKMRSFKNQQVVGQNHFDELSAFAFIQLYQSRRFPPFLPWFLIWFSVVAFPLVLLFAMDLLFVRFQSNEITWGHHIIFVIDLVFVVWFVWAVLPNYDESREFITIKCRVASRVIQAIIPMTLILIGGSFFYQSFYQSSEGITMGYCTVYTAYLMFFVWSVWVMRPHYRGISRVIQAVPDGMAILTTVVAIFMASFLFHSVNPPHFDPETVKNDLECIRNIDDVEKNDNVAKEKTCSNYVDRVLCKSVGICRYLNLRDEYLANTRSVDLTGLIPSELGDDDVEGIRWSVNDLHVDGRNFRFADFHAAELYGVNFREAKLEGANFKRAELHSAIFEKAQLHNTDFFAIRSKDSIFNKAKSQSANFRHARLQGSNFSEAQLQGSDFEKAVLTGVYFTKAGLQGVNFKDARLQVTDFIDAELQGVNFKNAELNGAVLYNAKLQGANFSGAELEGVDLGKAQLQGSFYEEEPGSWKLAWMLGVSFNFCCAEQYNKMIQEILEENSDVKLVWKKKGGEKEENEKKEEEKMFIWDKNVGKCEEKKGYAQDISLEDHLLCDYLMPNTASKGRMKLDCNKPPLKKKKSTIICYESGELYPPSHNEYWNDWTEKLAVLASKLACKNSYTAQRIFSRWTKDSDIWMEGSDKIFSRERWMVGRNTLDCQREKEKKTCPGLKTIPDGKWSQLWTKFDDDLPESSCTKPSSSS